MPALRAAFLGMLVLLLAICAVRAPWLAVGRASQGTYLMDLAAAPLWSPPPSPSRDHFVATFASLAATAETTLVIDVRVRWGCLLVTTASTFAVPSLLCGLWYWAARERRLDAVLHAALGSGIGTLAAAVLCIALWAVLGGWGPPFAVPLAVIGPVAGALGGLWRHRRLARRPLP